MTCPHCSEAVRFGRVQWANRFIVRWLFRGYLEAIFSRGYSRGPASFTPFNPYPLSSAKRIAAVPKAVSPHSPRHRSPGRWRAREHPSNIREVVECGGGGMGGTPLSGPT